MKKCMLLAALCMAMTMTAQAQDYRRGHHNWGNQGNRYDHTDTEIYYGLRLGLAMATVSSDDPSLDGGDVRTGLNVGGVIGFGLSNAAPLYLETGLFYTEKGGKGKFNGKKFTYGLDYLEIPIAVKYHVDLQNDINIQPFIGGYFGIGIAGKIKDYGDRKASDSFDDDAFKRMDAGLKFGCGIEYQMLYGELGYDLGLANICHDMFDTSRTRCFYINIGVNF